MNYSLVSDIPGEKRWKELLVSLENTNSKLITLVASPGLGRYAAGSKVKVINILDRLTGRIYSKGSYRFFNDVPVPSWSKIDMNRDGSISIVDKGEEIAKEFVYSNTRRAVQDIRYTNPDGSIDYIEEFAFDGSIFSNLFYADGNIQEMVFYNQSFEPVTRYYFYQGKINYVTIEDPKTHHVLKHFNSINAYYRDQITEIVSASDRVTIFYMGSELMALQDAKSHNVLHLSESPLDTDGKVRGNLVSILKNIVTNIHEVEVTQEQFDVLKEKGMPLDKLTILD